MAIKASVIGAGISGPVAALALANAGYDVTVYERRNEYDLNSPGILGITPENWRALNRAGASVAAYSLGTLMRDHFTGNVRHYDGYNIQWTDLHNELVYAGKRVGVQYRFNTEVSPRHSLNGIVVRAGGVGMAAKDGRQADYTGYVVHRGLSAMRVNADWVTVRDPNKNYLFNAGDLADGASWALFAYDSKPPRGTVNVSTIPLIAWAIPREFVNVIAATPEWQMAPISDWAPPVTIADSNYRVHTIGDANGAMRPHTGMGANLGITEALSIPKLLAGNAEDKMQREFELTESRDAQRSRGIRLGYEIMGSALA
jgi:2-polyprenyl-6-methoxyphenol hydroxylase-like FAD-dependent oxidoreductase